MKNTNGKDHFKRTQKDYSLAFKLQVVDEVEKGLFTYKQSQRKYGIQGRSTVLIWLRKHALLEESINLYNNYRPHLALEMKTPNEVYEQKKSRLPEATEIK